MAMEVEEEAEGESAEEGTEKWLDHGNRWLGSRVRRFFHSDVPYDGSIDLWMPAAGGEAALWHIHYDDGDEEELEEDEVRTARWLYARKHLDKKEKASTSAVRTPAWHKAGVRSAPSTTRMSNRIAGAPKVDYHDESDSNDSSEMERWSTDAESNEDPEGSAHAESASDNDREWRRQRRSRLHMCPSSSANTSARTTPLPPPFAY